MAGRMQASTLVALLLFGVNFIFYVLFQAVLRHKNYNNQEDKIEKTSGKEEKNLSKPFTGTLDCWVNLTSELNRVGLIMLLTYVCEYHWIFDHSSKSYSRDLFIFVLIIFFVYGLYTIKPSHDLTLLGREQTEEWKGWMQFIFLLYHYFHAEEVYNSVRVMITCYVWMTGFGNFSFFYMKKDYGWLRVAQMLWRLNFSVILLMLTHNNTYILYYICPMHTFYFLMVYITMYIFQNYNYSKWGIRIKLFILGLIIFVIWDVNGGVFDIIFRWLGNDSVVGASYGSVWEWYFRTSLDHYSTFFGMIFALNFPLAEQYYELSKNTLSLKVACVLMGILSIYWFFNFYTLEKLSYNLSHSYTAIIPLIAYIFFRNIPILRTGYSGSLHDLGKTTLETYLLQHHIWLTSNAKTLLTITPGHPWINFALATMLFFVVSKELYRLTMSLRGMILPDDAKVAKVNIFATLIILSALYIIAQILFALQASSVMVMSTIIALVLLTLLLIHRFFRSLAENKSYEVISGVIIKLLSGFLVVFLMLSVAITNDTDLPITKDISYISPPYNCLDSLSHGRWELQHCDETTHGSAYCETMKWQWQNHDNICPFTKYSADKVGSLYKNKNILFIGDSIVRNSYHQYNYLISQNSYDREVYANVDRHVNLYHHDAMNNINVTFYWAPMMKNITDTLLASDESGKKYHMIVAGCAPWDALYNRNVQAYKNELNRLGGSSSGNNETIKIWLQTTAIIDGRLNTNDKHTYMTEDIIKQYRSAFIESKAVDYFQVDIDPQAVTQYRESGSVDGVHYGDEVYSVIAQMVVNGFALHFPRLFSKGNVGIKQNIPKPTGSMSFPISGVMVLMTALVMLVTMDSFFGIGYISLVIFGKKYDYEKAYNPLIDKINRTHTPPVQPISDAAGDDERDSLLGTNA